VNTGDIGGILVWCILDSCYTCIRESKPRQWSTLDFVSDWHNDDRPRRWQLWTPPVVNLPGLLPHWYLSHSNYGCRRLGICLSFLSWLDDLFAPMDASGSESIPQQCLGPNAPMSTTQGRCLGLGIYSPGVPATRRAAANGGRAMSRFGIYPPAVPTTRRAGSTTEEQCPALGIYPQECLRPDSPRSTTQGLCPGFAADGVWQLVPVPCGDCSVPMQ
jgi:hypothetical protein